MKVDGLLDPNFIEKEREAADKFHDFLGRQIGEFCKDSNVSVGSVAVVLVNFLGVTIKQTGDYKMAFLETVIDELKNKVSEADGLH